MNAVLVSALEAIRAERNSRFDRSFREARRVLDEFGEDGIADRLLSATSLDAPAEDLADLLGILTWTEREDDSSIALDAERWLREGKDERRMWIALHLEAYPFREQAEMEEVLSRIAEKHPSLAVRCSELISNRGKLNEA